jgi:hypothetical protein
MLLLQLFDVLGFVLALDLLCLDAQEIVVHLLQDDRCALSISSDLTRETHAASECHHFLRRRITPYVGALFFPERELVLLIQRVGNEPHKILVVLDNACVDRVAAGRHRSERRRSVRRRRRICQGYFFEAWRARSPAFAIAVGVGVAGLTATHVDILDECGAPRS